MTSTSPRLPRRVFAAVASVALAATGLAAVTAPAQAATQSVRLSVSPSSAFTATPVRADFLLSNPATNTGTVGIFTIVVPPGVGKVTGAGVTGLGTWGESVLPCGATANCSSLVLVYAGLPLSTSLLKPGKSLTASISFTTPAAPASLTFKFLGIGNGLFTTTDTPTINVTNGAAAQFAITSSSIVGPDFKATAGVSQSLILQTQNSDKQSTGFSGGVAHIQLGTDDSRAKLTYPDPVTHLPVTTTFPPAVSPDHSVLDLPLPSSSSGTYPFSISFGAAGPTSVKATLAANSLVTGLLETVNVVPAAASTLTLTNVRDQATGSTTLAVGAVIVSSFEVRDEFTNVIPTLSTSVSLSASGLTGALTAVPGGVSSTNTTDGTVLSTYNKPDQGVTFTASLGSILSNPVTGSFAAVAAGAAFFVPTVPGAIEAANCALGTTAGVTACGTGNFPFGANGNVTLTMDPCSTTSGLPTTGQNLCNGSGGNVVASLTAKLKKDDGTKLYSAALPASFTYQCAAADCPKLVEDATYVYNGQDEKVDDFNRFQPFAELSGLLSFTLVPPCQTGAITEGPAYGGAVLDNVTTVPAGTQICVDVMSFTRDTVTDNLSFTVYYYDDLKIVSGR